MLGLRPVLHSVVCICVCKHPHLHTTLCSAHLRCANTSEEKKTSILEEEKSYRRKTSGPELGTTIGPAKFFLGFALFSSSKMEDFFSLMKTAHSLEWALLKSGRQMGELALTDA